MKVENRSSTGLKNSEKSLGKSNKLIKIFATVTVTIASLYFSTSLDGQLKNINGDDVDSSQIRSVIIESWETEPWDVQAIPGPPEGLATSNIVPGKPANLNKNSKNQKSMGIRFNFVYPGNNSVVITPPKSRSVRRPTGQLDEKNTPKYIDIPGVELPGRASALSVWVLGRGNDARLECWLQDWRGDVHLFRFGSLKFIGWRPLTIKIPIGVPQQANSFPQTRNMILKRLILRTAPAVPSEEVVLFFDSLKVLTNLYDLHFDGAEMDYDERDKQYKNQLSNYQKKLIQGNQDY